ncbi:MAG: TolC family protein [Planctomycetes bacterium]|nr:TolC family protein [Planctomycetota bacterium]
MRKTLGVLVGVVLVLGCTGQPKIPPAAETAPAPSKTEAARSQPETPPKTPAPVKDEKRDAGGDDLAESITLRKCIDQALRLNPEIRSARLLASALQHRVTQARSLDDPRVSVGVYTDPLQTAAGPVHSTVGVSQKLPFPGKLSLRGRVAHENAVAARELARSVEQRVLADVKKTYYAVYVAHKAIEVNQRNQKLLASLARLAQVKYEIGKGTKQDALRAQVALSKLRDQLIRFEQELETAEAKLNMLLNRAVTAKVGAPADFAVKEIDLRIAGLLDLAAENRPELLALKHAISRDEFNKDLAVLDFFPDLTLGFTYSDIGRHGLSPVANGQEAWALTFSANVPIWYDRLMEGVREAKDMLAKSHADYEQRKNLTFFEVKDAIVRVKTSERLARLFRDTIIPQARQTLEAAQSGYQVGKVDFLTVLDNWRGLLDFELELYRAKASLEQNFAELERAIGAELAPGGRAMPEKKAKP